MLHFRKRGQYYHVYGTVCIGNKTKKIPEHSSRCDSLKKAQEYASRLEEDIRNELLYGKDINAGKITFGEIAQEYINRPGGINPQDLSRIEDKFLAFENYPVDEAMAIWKGFLRNNPELAPSTIDRIRTLFLAILNHCRDEYGYKVPVIPKPKYNDQKSIYLPTIEQRERLLFAYPFHVKLIATMLCFNGCRCSEATTLNWSDVNFERRTIIYRNTKNGESRIVPMHGRTYQALQLARKRQIDNNCYDPQGRVFLNKNLKPYRDTRKSGGTPIDKAHRTACRIAGITDFTIHDWRHHWASWCVMSGMNDTTLMKLGGWKKHSMIQRYAALRTEYMAEELNKVK